MTSKTTKGYKPKKHEATKLQEKLKKKDWNPMDEILEIMNEYEEGTPKRSSGFQDGGE